jgi:hypothetical protein
MSGSALKGAWTRQPASPASLSRVRGTAPQRPAASPQALPLLRHCDHVGESRASLSRLVQSDQTAQARPRRSTYLLFHLNGFPPSSRRRPQFAGRESRCEGPDAVSFR